MPVLITDDMVKKECAMSRPIPMKALGIMKPNRKVGFKPNYIKQGRSGIRYTELPTYAPASVNSLVQSICNITKLETSEVENYLENAISQQIGQEIIEDENFYLSELFDDDYEYEEEEETKEEIYAEEEKGEGVEEMKAADTPRKIRSDFGMLRGKQKRTLEKEQMAAEDKVSPVAGRTRSQTEVIASRTRSHDDENPRSTDRDEL